MIACVFLEILEEQAAFQRIRRADELINAH